MTNEIPFDYTKNDKIKYDEGIFLPIGIMKINELTVNIVAWRKEKGFITGWDNMQEKLLLCHSEISEATEKLREIDFTNPNSDKMDSFAEEIADTIIRCLDILGTVGFNPENVIVDKMKYNWTRSYKHGKSF